jgi:hypothetical protein
MLAAGFAPNNAYSLIDWLGKIAASRAERAAEVLVELLNNPHVKRWSFITRREALRSIFECGLQCGNAATEQRTKEAINVLATGGETSYLDLVRPGSGPPVRCSRG